MLDELSAMLVERLQFFEKKNRGILPTRIIVYRDGVSEVCLVLTYLLAYIY